MPAIVVDVGCRGLLPQLSRALHDFASVHRDVSEELAVAASAPLDDVTVVILGMRGADGRPVPKLVRRIRRRLPHVAVYVCAVGQDGWLLASPELARAGVDDVVGLDGPSEIAEFRSRLQARLLAPPPETAIRDLAERLDE